MNPKPAAKPAAEVVRSTGWIVALVAVLGAVAFIYAPLFAYSYKEWLKPDYSHGFLVPLFAGFLAWHWRSYAPKEFAWAGQVGQFKLVPRQGVAQVAHVQEATLGDAVEQFFNELGSAHSKPRGTDLA